MGDIRWLNARRKGIGGSDVAPILGLSPWRTAYQIWEEKLHLRDGQEKTPEMSYGLLVEPALRQWYSNETGRVVRLPDKIMVHPQHSFMLANLDGLTDDGRVIEIKTARSSRDWGEPGTDEIPAYYQTQIQHYLMVTGLVVADVVVSFSGSMPEVYECHADQELQDIILEKETEFWKLVESKTPPDPITYSDMIARFKKSTTASVVASEKCLMALEYLKTCRHNIKEEEKDEESYKALIMSELGEADTLVDSEGKVLLTWKQGKPTRRFNAKAFQVDHPDLYLKYLEDGEPTRRFLLK